VKFILVVCLVRYIFGSSRRERTLYDRWSSAEDRIMIFGPDRFLNSTIERPEVFGRPSVKGFAVPDIAKGDHADAKRTKVGPL
jgi:hypothetical protein